MWFQSNWAYFWPSKKIITKDLESLNSNILEIRMSWTKVKRGQFSKPTHSFCRRNNGMVPSMVWLTFLTWFTTNSLLLAVCSLWLGCGYKRRIEACWSRGVHPTILTDQLAPLYQPKVNFSPMSPNLGRTYPHTLRSLLNEQLTLLHIYVIKRAIDRRRIF